MQTGVIKKKLRNIGLCNKTLNDWTGPRGSQRGEASEKKFEVLLPAGGEVDVRQSSIGVDRLQQGFRVSLPGHISYDRRTGSYRTFFFKIRFYYKIEVRKNTQNKVEFTELL